MNKYILDTFDKECDKLVKFDIEKVKDYVINLYDVQEMRLGGVELLVYSFLLANAYEYWAQPDLSAPAGEVFMQMDLYDFVKVTGCSVQEVRNALEILNQERWVRVIEVKGKHGTQYAFHATT